MAAEQIVSSATSSVTGEVVRILFSGIVGRIYRKAVAANKKLRRLKLLLIKIHSVVEASKKHTIENAWLLEWRDTLREAAAEGDEVLAGFRQRQRASTDDAAPGPGDDDARHQQQEQERPSSSSSTTASAAAARNDNAPSSSGSARSTRGPTETRLSSTGEDMERLNSVVERLEELSPEIGMFVKLLKLEILTPEQATAENRARYLKRARPARHSSRCEPHDLEILTSEQRSMENPESMRFAKRTRPSASDGNEQSGFKLFGCSLNAVEPGIAPALGMNKEEGSEESCRKTPTTGETVDATTQEEQERSTTLVDRLEEAFAAICRTVELADGRDLRGREWLVRWASMLREAKARGCAVLGAISARRSATVAADAGSHRRCAAEATAVDSTSLPDDWDDYELGRFVCGMESLAAEVDYFVGLACLCPSY